MSLPRQVGPAYNGERDRAQNGPHFARNNGYRERPASLARASCPVLSELRAIGPEMALESLSAGRALRLGL